MFSHEALVGGEMNLEAGMPLQPALDLGMLVRGVDVHKQMQLFVRGRGIIQPP